MSSVASTAIASIPLASLAASLPEHEHASNLKLCVCVRKRPLFHKEAKAGEIDVISCANPKIIIHEPKVKVDGITKYV